MALPVADPPAPVASLDDAFGPEDDQSANTVNLRLDGEPLGVADRGQQTSAAIVGHELGNDVEHDRNGKAPT